MSDLKKGIILVGHGGIPKGFPADEVSKLKRLEAQRRAAGQPMSAEELALDTKIRTWPPHAGNRPLSGWPRSLRGTHETHGEWGAVLISV